MKYLYKAKKGVDKNVQGEIEAVNADDALNKLCAEGLFPVSIEPAPLSQEQLQAQKTRRQKRPFGFGSRISSRQLLMFTQKLSTLVRAKVELLVALRVLHEQTDNPAFQKVILELYNDTKTGKLFSDSLARFPHVFPSMFTNIIKAGEASGSLDKALDQIHNFLSREDVLRNKVTVALAYPAVLLVVGIGSIFVLINFVIPKLKPVLEGFGKELPVITKMIFSLSDVSHKVWLIVLAAIAAVILAACSRKGKVIAGKINRAMIMRVPVINGVVRNQELEHFARSLGLLLESGVPALRALEIVTPQAYDPRLRKEFQAVCAQVAAGQSLAKSVDLYTTLPGFFTKMIAIGEESGRLVEVLDEIARSYSQQIESDIALISSLLEPVLILVMGGILGTIVLAILIPMFQLTQIIR